MPDYVRYQPAADDPTSLRPFLDRLVADILARTPATPAMPATPTPPAAPVVTFSEETKISTDRIVLIDALWKAVPLVEKSGDAAMLRKIIQIIIKDADGHYLSYSQEAEHQVSYAKKPEFKLNNKQRTRTTLGRYIRRELTILEADMSSKSLNDLTDAVFGILVARQGAEHPDFQVIQGAAIVQAYGEALGGTSCMTGQSSGNAKILDLYAINPDKVSMLLYKSDNGGKGGYARALLWTADDGTRVLDRIYPNAGNHVTAMKTWASNQKFLVRENDRMPNHTGEVRLTPHKRLTATLKMTPTGLFPYLDTFHWGYFDKKADKNRGIVVLTTFEDDKTTMRYESTGGGFANVNGGERSLARDPEDEDDGMVQCVHCGESLDANDSFTYGDDCYCGDCYGECHPSCDHCGATSGSPDELCTINTGLGNTELWCDDCRDRHACTCDVCEETCASDIIHDDPDGDNICEACGTRCSVCRTWARGEDLDDAGRCVNCRAEAATPVAPIAPSDTTPDDVAASLARIAANMGGSRLRR